jgi:hypothetical protein
VRTLAAVLLLCAALGLAGCVADATGGAAPAGGTQAPSGAPAAPRSSPTASDPHGALVCSADDLAGIDTTVAGQLDALAAGDYQDALTFSSARFRSSTTPEAFGALIERDYAVMTDDARHTSGTCVRAGEAAQVLVVVTGASGTEQEFVYTLVREDGDWRVDVAGPAPETGTGPIEA